MILEDEIGDGPLTFILILKSCGVCEWNPGPSFLLHYLPLTSSHLLLIPPNYSTLLPNLLLPPPEWSHMTNQFTHEEISKLFCSEKFYGGGLVGGMEIRAWSSRSRFEFEIDLEIKTFRVNLDPSLTTSITFSSSSDICTIRANHSCISSIANCDCQSSIISSFQVLVMANSRCLKLKLNLNNRSRTEQCQSPTTNPP